MSQQASLQSVLQHASIWRGSSDFHHSHTEQHEFKQLPTGHPILDQQLPTAGWPHGALIEILHDYPGQGELQLVLPALARLSQQQQRIAMINPPWIPYAPALQSSGVDLTHFFSIGPLNASDQLWALEQTLRSGHFQAVLAWPDTDLSIPILRRLQLAAETGQVSGFLFRHSAVQKQHSPAALRIALSPASCAEGRAISLDIFKCRGRHFRQPIHISLPTPESIAA